MLTSLIFLTSCASEIVDQGPDFSKSSYIHLSLIPDKSDSSTGISRSNGALPTDNGNIAGNNEGSLNHICVALFNSNGVLITIHEYDYVKGSTETIATRSDATQMLVFANIPSGNFSGKYTLNDFYTVSQNLGYTTSSDAQSNSSVTTPNSQSMKSLPMMSAVQPLNWSSGTVLTPTVPLTRLVARVALTSLTKSFSGAFQGCSFTPTEVFMYNASNQLTNWSTNATGGNVSGENIAANANTAYLGSGTISTYSEPYYFYVFPHGSTTPTKLVIKGTFKTNSGSTYTTYYPITVNSNVSGNIVSTVITGTGDSKISSNTTYGLAVTLNGTGVTNVSDELTPTNVTVTTSVAGYTSATVPEYFGPKIGDIFYSDGSYSSSLISGKTPVAIVFSTTTSATDKANGFVHGYAMALKNASTGVAWGPTTTTPTGSASTTLNITDYDGLSYTGKINSSTYPAAYAAATTFNSTVPNPSGTSGWYLPGIGQWYQICINLGGMSTSFTDNRTSGWLRWYSGDDSSGKDYSSLCASAINVYLNTLKTNGYSVDLFSNSNEVYWCSSEYNAGYAYTANFNSLGYMRLDYTYKTSSYRCRAVLAF